MHEIEELYLSIYKQKVNTMGRILGGDYSAGEDVTQEAFCRAWKFYPSFDPNIGKLETWFNAILYNSLRDYQREMKGEPSSQAKEISPEDVLMNINTDFTLIRKEIGEIRNNKHRRVLELFFIMGYTSTEINQIEEKVSVSNVTTIVNRFREDISDE